MIGKSTRQVQRLEKKILLKWKLWRKINGILWI
jgi:hypothetical protein